MNINATASASCRSVAFFRPCETFYCEIIHADINSRQGLTQCIRKKMKLPKLDFTNTPFMSGIFFGLYASGWVLLLTSCSIIVFSIIFAFDRDPSGATFMIVLIIPAYFAGSPWTNLTIDNSAMPHSIMTYLWGIVVGNLINGLLLGIVVGIIATIHQAIKLGRAR